MIEIKLHFWGQLLLLAFCVLAWNDPCFGQDNTRDTVPVEEVFIDFSDKLTGEEIDGIAYQFMRGNVTLHQGNVFMYCDTATLYENNVEAYGNVRIQKGDTTSVFADSLSYFGNEKIGTLYSLSDSSRVILVDGDRELFTRELEYDLHQNIARYHNKGILKSGSSSLYSESGIYYLDQKEVFFKDSVFIVDTNFVLRADTLKFQTEEQIATFLGPTLIVQGKSRIFCESGYYDLDDEEARFEQNPQYARGETKATSSVMEYSGAKNEVLLLGEAKLRDSVRTATADQIRYDELREIAYLEGNAVFLNEGQEVISDTIVYNSNNNTYATSGKSKVTDESQILQADQLNFDNETGIGNAEGNVTFADTAENIIIKSDIVDYDQSNDRVKAFGDRPLFITVLEGDSLFMASDTLRSFRDTTSEDSTRFLIADNRVRVFKSNLQAICDSLVYHSSDSIFYFYDNPVIWSDTSQFSADTVWIQLKNDQIHKIIMRHNSLIVNSFDEEYFNQIKGKYITAYFKENELYKMDVDGNAEAVYYIVDEQKAYVGPNKVVCSEMTLLFDNNQVTDITFYGAPEGNLVPMNMADHEQIKVPGFFWEVEKRPKNADDLRDVFAVLNDLEEEELPIKKELPAEEDVPPKPSLKKD